MKKYAIIWTKNSITDEIEKHEVSVQVLGDLKHIISYCSDNFITYRGDLIHCENGPAIEFFDGKNTLIEYYLDGEKLTNKKWDEKMLEQKIKLI